MHKDEASNGFKILSNPDNVKISKMLYTNGNLSYDDLLIMIGSTEEELKDSLKLMEKGNLIRKLDDEVYSINKEYIDELLDFIRTPCGCGKKL